jgi:hypothetical protein
MPAEALAACKQNLESQGRQARDQNDQTVICEARSLDANPILETSETIPMLTPPKFQLKNSNLSPTHKTRKNVITSATSPPVTLQAVQKSVIINETSPKLCASETSDQCHFLGLRTNVQKEKL